MCAKTGTNGCSKKDTVLIDVVGPGAITYSAAGNVLTANATGAIAFQWYQDGAPIAGATGSVYTIAVSGIYCVEAT